MTGGRIGQFEIGELLGAGGMGEVYRARDTRLGRDVAIKIVHPSFTRDPVRRARFEREARLLASLNHPGIATLHGVEDRPNGLVLVMELVEGQTLADRIAFGPLRIDEALDIAGQVAEGLEAAHKRGVVHRDLKPSNIAIRSDGMVKLLDFGLAKAIGTGDAGEAGPTVTVTVDGIGPGTPAYMSPEQTRGLDVDTRTDVWAFGCVLYEMLTGRRAFTGDRMSDVIAKVLEREPDFAQLPADVPETIRRLLRRCLAKDPQDRLRDIGDARLDLRELAAVEGANEKPRDGRRRAIPSRWRWWAAAVVTLAAGAILALGNHVWRAPSPPSARDERTTVQLPHGSSVTRGPGVASSVAVSPDGRTIVVAATDAGGQRLYQRPIDRLEATPIQGTERGSSPFFSWDGAWIGFAADGWLKRVPAGGGGAVNIVRLAGFPAGASWGPDDRIVFAYGADESLRVVDARGGEAEVLLPGQPAYRPEVLPDGHTVLYESGGWVHAFDRQTGRKTRLVRGGAPRFANGQVIVVAPDNSTLLAASFEQSRHEIGPMDPLVERVAAEAATIGLMAHYAVSREGTLVYVPSHEMFSLVVVQADGTEHRLTGDQFRFHNPRFSPDGEQVVVAARRRADEPSDLWLHDLRTGKATRLTFDGASRPFWGPAVDTITYSRPLPNQGSGIYTILADGGNGVRQILPLSSIHWLVGWTRLPRTLVYGAMEGTASSIMAFTDSSPPRRVIGPGAVWGGRLSPDGRWLAYSSSDSGSFQVLVTSFPGGAPQWPIADGTDPGWSPDGREVYYRSGSRLMAARIDITGGVVRASSHRVAHEPFQPPTYDDYDIHRDGRTLVLVRPANPVQLREVSVTRNWQAQLNPRTRDEDRTP